MRGLLPRLASVEVGRRDADPPYLVRSLPSPCVLGAIYWLVGLPSPPTGCCTTPGMLRFDMHTEEFAGFPSPSCVQQLDDANGVLAELAGKLCYGHVPDDRTVQLWIAAADEWSLQCTVVLCHPFHHVIPFADDYQGGILFNVDYSVIYRYDVERGVMERMVGMNNEMTY
uniref:F-box associated domain-containing protein n=1 Tax=Oryza brachyantha TaxID=4533 RepID=J3MBM9_ORYBR